MENINELINIFDELINQKIITYPTCLMEIYNCINNKHYNSDDNFIQINYQQLLNQGLFLVKNNIITKIITDHSIGNFNLVKMDSISINILLTHRENILTCEQTVNQTTDNRNMYFAMQSFVKKRNYKNGYSKYSKK
ncbi:hypothetical protein TONV_126 [Tipula oleracea nudivirus]|uniref:Uncharacterized protein n=1 Tax=Tipula oleracea nudivirus TaxID=1546257 RepID=A0A0B4VGH7_9VIRU|nr:hypothetical protein TONV_126 [Tipula oleracea nudivirus]AJD20186.1 hypothetical protein TONV_126 [Tipula oleracea nudivirus]